MKLKFDQSKGSSGTLTSIQSNTENENRKLEMTSFSFYLTFLFFSFYTQKTWMNKKGMFGPCKCCVVRNIMPLVIIWRKNQKKRQLIEKEKKLQFKGYNFGVGFYMMSLVSIYSYVLQHVLVLLPLSPHHINVSNIIIIFCIHGGFGVMKLICV